VVAVCLVQATDQRLTSSLLWKSMTVTCYVHLSVHHKWTGSCHHLLQMLSSCC